MITGGNMIIQDEYITFTIGRQKKIALIAHDSKKQDLVEWVQDNLDILKSHFLCGTGTTARLIAEQTTLPVKAYNSGPLGGDQQIGSRIVEGAVDFVVFFWDPLEAQPHDPDVKALLRIAVVYDIPIANNRATADFLLTSTYMSSEYERRVVNYNRTIQDRIEQLK
jgi:methylglyoxal synthase